MKHGHFFGALGGALFGLASVWIGCDSDVVDGTGGAGGSGGSGDQAAACADYAAALCAKLASCGAVQLQFQYGDEATCVVAESAACAAFFGRPGIAEDPAGTRAAGSGIASSDCSGLVVADQPYPYAPSAGQLDEGSACSVDAQCTSGFCLLDQPAACGTCAAPRADGAGEACQPIVFPSGSGLACYDGFVCDEATTTCVAIPGEGQACPAEVCTAGLACSDGVCTARGGADTACSETGQPCNFYEGFLCDLATGFCSTEVVAFAMVGDPCPSAGTLGCVGGTYCGLGPNPDGPGVCTVRGREGDPCQYDDECLFRFGCVDGACTAAIGQGCGG